MAAAPTRRRACRQRTERTAWRLERTAGLDLLSQMLFSEGGTIDLQVVRSLIEIRSALAPDIDTVARALDAWRDEGVGHVQVDLRPADERTIEVLLEARAKHLGEA